MTNAVVRYMHAAWFKGPAPEPLRFRRPGETETKERPTLADFRRALLGGG